MRLKWKEDGTIKTPLARAKGLGSTHEGVEHWVNQRITAIANIPLMIWLVWSVVTHLKDSSYDVFTQWLAQPLNSILMILAIISVFYHAALGSQVIAEDYISNEAMRFAKLIGIKLFFLAGAITCIFCVIKISLGS